MNINFITQMPNTRYFTKKSVENKNCFEFKQIDSNFLTCAASYNLPFLAHYNKPVYLVNYDGTYQKFDTIRDAQKIYGTQVNAILSNNSHTSVDYTFVRADELESENGEVRNESLNKTLQVFKDSRSQPVYAIRFDSHIERFNNINECSKATGIPVSQIGYIIAGKMPAAKNYVFAKAFDIEMRDSKEKLLLDDEGKQVLDIDKIFKLRENFLEKDKRYPIVKIDKNRNVEFYFDFSDAAQKLGVDKTQVISAFRQNKPLNGFMFCKLSDMVIRDGDDVLYDADGNYELDQNAIDTQVSFLN